MSRVLVREARSAAPRVVPGPRSRREFRDVRDPRLPDLRVELVRVCPSGIHVITSVTDPTGPAPGDAVVHLARDAARVVAELLPPRYRARVHPLLCRTDDAEVADLVDGILVTSRVPLEHVLRSSPVVLSTSEINEVGMRLGARLEAFPVETVQGRAGRRWWRVVLGTALVGAAGAAAAVQDLVPLSP